MWARPTTHYVLALLLIGCAAIASHTVLVQSLAELEEDSVVINTSGRQRMLSEQTVRLAGELMVTNNPVEALALKTQLTRSLDLMRTSHEKLSSSIGETSAATGTRADLSEAYFGGERSLDTRLAQYFAALDQILALKRLAYSPSLGAYRTLVDAHRGGILRDLDRVVKLHELQAQERLQASERLHVYIMAGTLLLLLLEALFVFRPLIRRLTRANDELVSQNNEIAHMAVSDTLTNLPNRSGFGQRLESLIEARSGADQCAAVMMLDLDRFKNVNDTLGHPAGDRVLIEVGKRIEANIKNVDTVARLGGDEFAIILRQLNGPQDASAIAQKIIEAVSTRITLAEGEASVGASIGITILPETASASEEVMKRADLALFQAKQNGRGQHCFYDPHMQEELTRKSQVADELHHACLESRLQVFLQPIFSFKTGKIEFAESLIRWDHSERGLISAHEFIDIIDEFQMAPQLETIVYEQVFTTLARWRDQEIEFPAITINVSAVNLRQTNFCNRLVDAMEKYQLDPSLVALEILESVFVDRGAETVIANIRQLHELGFPILLDDFGTGYASLSHLMDIPVHGIKIDKTFVQGVGEGGPPEQIASAVLALAKDLDIVTVGEGIETPEQMKYLERRGCDFAQGFHFAKPVPISEFDALLQAGAFGMNSAHVWLQERRSG